MTALDPPHVTRYDAEADDARHRVQQQLLKLRSLRAELQARFSPTRDHERAARILGPLPDDPTGYTELKDWLREAEAVEAALTEQHRTQIPTCAELHEQILNVRCEVSITPEQVREWKRAAEAGEGRRVTVEELRAELKTRAAQVNTADAASQQSEVSEANV